eukprot:tig00000571_g2166.t1
MVVESTASDIERRFYQYDDSNGWTLRAELPAEPNYSASSVDNEYVDPATGWVAQYGSWVPPPAPESLDAVKPTYYDENLYDFDDDTAFTDGATIPTDGATIPTDGATIPTDGATIPTDGATIPTDGATIPTDGATIPTDGATIPTDGATIPTDGATIPTDGATIPTDGATIPTDGATIPTDGATIPTDGATIPTGVTTSTVSQPCQELNAAPGVKIEAGSYELPFSEVGKIRVDTAVYNGTGPYSMDGTKIQGYTYTDPYKQTKTFDSTDSYTETGKYVIRQQVTPTDIYYGKEVPITSSAYTPTPADDKITWTRDEKTESFNGTSSSQTPKAPSSPERLPAPGAPGEWTQEGLTITTTKNEFITYAAAQQACSGTGPCFNAHLHTLSVESAKPIADLASITDAAVKAQIDNMLLNALALDTNLDPEAVTRVALAGTTQAKDVQTIPYTLTYDVNTHKDLQRTVEEKGTFSKTETGTISGVGPYTFLDGGFNIGQYAKPGLEVGRYEVHAREDRETTTKTAHSEAENINPIQTLLPGSTQLPNGAPSVTPTSKITGARVETTETRTDLKQAFVPEKLIPGTMDVTPDFQAAAPGPKSCVSGTCLAVQGPSVDYTASITSMCRDGGKCEVPADLKCPLPTDAVPAPAAAPTFDGKIYVNGSPIMTAADGGKLCLTSTGGPNVYFAPCKMGTAIAEDGTQYPTVDPSQFWTTVDFEGVQYANAFMNWLTGDIITSTGGLSDAHEEGDTLTMAPSEWANEYKIGMSTGPHQMDFGAAFARFDHASSTLRFSSNDSLCVASQGEGQPAVLKTCAEESEGIHFYNSNIFAPDSGLPLSTVAPLKNGDPTARPVHFNTYFYELPNATYVDGYSAPALVPSKLAVASDLDLESIYRLDSDVASVDAAGEDEDEAAAVDDETLAEAESLEAVELEGGFAGEAAV